MTKPFPTLPEITLPIAQRVLATVDAGLTAGLGQPLPGQMCVEAAVCYALGLPHGDDPGCVAPALRTLKIRLNDSRWASPQARAQGLRRLALAQLGSKGMLDEKEFARRVAELAIRLCAPIALRAAAKRQSDSSKAAALREAADLCEQEPTRENALEARMVADAAYAYAAYAYAAADAAYAAAAAAAANCLSAFAEGVVQILIDMKTPGCQWLGLTQQQPSTEPR